MNNRLRQRVTRKTVAESIKNELKELVDKFPNDAELGKEVRKLVKE